MKYFFTVCAFIFLSTVSVYGQRSWGIRVYQNTDFFKVVKSTDSGKEEKLHSNLGRFSLAFTVSGKKRFNHELELFLPEFNRPIDKVMFPYPYKYNIQVTDIKKSDTYSFRYSVSKIFGLPSDRFRLSLGAGVNPYFIRTDYNVYFVHGGYSGYYQTKGISLNILPAMQYRISKRFDLSVSVPFKLFDYKWLKQYSPNPAVPISQETRKDTKKDFLDQAYTIRLGLHFNLSKPGSEDSKDSKQASKNSKSASKKPKYKRKSKRSRR